MNIEDVQVTPRLIKHNLEYYTHGQKVNPVYYEDPSNVKIADKILNNLDTLFGLDQRNKKLFEKSILKLKEAFLELGEGFIKTKDKNAKMVKLFLDNFHAESARPIFGVGLAESDTRKYIVFFGHGKFKFEQIYFPIKNKLFKFSDIDLKFIHSSLEKNRYFYSLDSYFKELTKPMPVMDMLDKKEREIFKGVFE
jgi:hypothetical protein